MVFNIFWNHQNKREGQEFLRIGSLKYIEYLNGSFYIVTLHNILSLNPWGYGSTMELLNDFVSHQAAKKGHEYPNTGD